MKNNHAASINTLYSRENHACVAADDMTSAVVWTPDYVSRLQQKAHRCRCPGCDGASPLLQLRWKNHVRYSADINCNSAATEILCHSARCTIAFSEAASENLPELASERLQINQSCLRLFEVLRAQPELLLYSLGRFIQQAAMSEPEQWAALTDAWLQPAARQRLAHDFIRRKPEERGDVEAFGALCAMPVWAEVSGGGLAEKLAKTLQSEKALREEMQRLMHGSPTSGQQKTIGNYLFYELCHNLFPGSPPDGWQQNFIRLGQHIFCLKMILAIADRYRLDRETRGKLFAAWHRKTPHAATSALAAH